MGWGFKKAEDLFMNASDFWMTRDPDAPQGFRPRVIADDHAVAASLSLGPHVPEAVSDYFDVARMLWVYGNVYYPFFSIAAVHAGLCIELALKERLRQTGIELPKNKQNLSGRLERATAEHWIRPENFSTISQRKDEQDFFIEAASNAGLSFDVTDIDESEEGMSVALLELLQHVRKLRNMHAHPDFLILMPPNWGLSQLQFTRELIEQLFPAPL